ncbi:MAG: TetR/AcrR family transcriptional regulator [Anaerolineales bacterium]|nr:TetR/AcrR family transcriptional regulator [Anaerolineales bacterium]
MAARHKESERKEIKNETRQLLLDAAAGEFSREGYVGANINRISTAAGFAKGTIYNYFASKRDLMNALIDEVGGAHVAAIVTHVSAETNPERKLEVFFRAGFAFVETNVNGSLTIVTTLYGPDLEFKARLFQAYQPLFRLLAEEVIAPGIAQGVFREVDVEQTAGLLMNFYLGTGSTLNTEGRVWLDSDLVADFALRALQK